MQSGQTKKRKKKKTDSLKITKSKFFGAKDKMLHSTQNEKRRILGLNKEKADARFKQFFYPRLIHPVIN